MVRFYIDADLIGLAKILVGVRADVTYPGDLGGIDVEGSTRSACPIQPDSKDRVWLPIVASNGWTVITRDRHMSSRPAEKAAITENGARVISLDARSQLTRWGQLEIVASQWRKIEELAILPGPFVYRVSRTGMSKVL